MHSITSGTKKKKKRKERDRKSEKKAAAALACSVPMRPLVVGMGNIIPNTYTWVNENNNRNINQCAIIMKLCCMPLFFCLYRISCRHCCSCESNRRKSISKSTTNEYVVWAWKKKLQHKKTQTHTAIHTQNSHIPNLMWEIKYGHKRMYTNIQYKQLQMSPKMWRHIFCLWRSTTDLSQCNFIASFFFSFDLTKYLGFIRWIKSHWWENMTNQFGIIRCVRKEIQ